MREGKRKPEVIEFLIFALQEKALFVTWYNQTQSITSVQCRFRTKYQQTSPVHNSILRWVENLNLHRYLENRSGSGRPSTSNNDVQAARNYFRSHPRRFTSRAESDLAIPQFTIHRILKKRFISSHKRCGDIINYYLLAVFNEKNLLREVSMIFRMIKIFCAATSFSTSVPLTCREQRTHRILIFRALKIRECIQSMECT